MGNSLLPHVKVVWNTEAMAVSGKVVPLVHINAITLVGHYLVQKSHQQQRSENTYAQYTCKYNYS